MDDSIAPNLLQARYWNEATSIEADAGAHRLGSGGLFVETASPPSRGALLEFELAIGREPPICGIVEVMHARTPAEATEREPAGMRVKFIHLEDESYAREVLARVVVPQSASLPPPPALSARADVEGEAAVASSRDEALWDHAVALEKDFFARASVVPVIVPDDEVADVIARRQAQPEFLARRQRLRRTFAAVVAGAAALFAASAVRGIDVEPPPAPAAAKVASAPTSPPRAPSPPAIDAANATRPAPVAAPEPPDPVAPAAPAAPPPELAAPAASAPPAIPPAAQLRSAGARPRAAAPPSRPASRPGSPPARGGGDAIYD